MDDLIAELNSIKDKLIIDVRSAEEYAEDGIEEHRNVSYEDLPKVLEKERVDKHAKLVIYCASGGRSSYVQEILEAKGYDNISNVLTVENARRLK